VEHVDELIYGQALYALSTDEEEQVALHVAECERCRRRLREAEALAASLAYAVPSTDPPPDLRDRVLASVEPVVDAAPAPAEPASGTVTAAPRRQRPRFAWWPRLSAVVVPALGVAVVALAIWGVSQQNRVSSLESSLQHAQVTRVGSLGSAVTKAGGKTTLFASIRSAPAGKTYEAWVMRGKVAIPAGIFAGGGTLQLTLTHAARPGDVIAITVEPAGGTKQPTTTPIANGTV
jgi:anti-sigma-K factor RskA